MEHQSKVLEKKLKKSVSDSNISHADKVTPGINKGVPDSNNSKFSSVQNLPVEGASTGSINETERIQQILARANSDYQGQENYMRKMAKYSC